jgi:acetyl-CoA carboxylase biotin carboxyl carrier protein
MFEETIVERIRPLARAFHDGGFARMCVREGSFEVEFRRAPRGAAAARASAAQVTPDGSSAARPSEAILADVVGVVRFLRPPVVEGQFLDADRELAFVETLGIRNPVRSRGPGRIAAVYVTDSEPVEYGQPLFAIER